MMNQTTKAVLLGAFAMGLGACAAPNGSPPPALESRPFPFEESRQVELVPYEAQGVKVAGAVTWYDGQTGGLSAYTEQRGRIHIERQPVGKDSPSKPEHAITLAGAACWSGRLDEQSDLVGRVSFHFASDESLYEYSQEKLARFLSAAAPSTRLHLIGYTDDIGTDDINVPLSKARAETIAKRIHATWPEVGVTTEGRGSCPPLLPNTTPENRAKNRRVEIYSLEDTQ